MTGSYDSWKTRSDLDDGPQDEFEELGEYEEAELNCGEDDDGQCMLAGTEYCDFECPFHNEVFGLTKAKP